MSVRLVKAKASSKYTKRRNKINKKETAARFTEYNKHSSDVTNAQILNFALSTVMLT